MVVCKMEAQHMYVILCLVYVLDQDFCVRSCVLRNGGMSGRAVSVKWRKFRLPQPDQHAVHGNFGPRLYVDICIMHSL